MLTDEKIKEMAEKEFPLPLPSDENEYERRSIELSRKHFIAGAKAAREEMMKGTNHEALKSKFFSMFGERSFRGYPLTQCHAIWEFFAPHLTGNGK